MPLVLTLKGIKFLFIIFITLCVSMLSSGGCERRGRRNIVCNASLYIGDEDMYCGFCDEKFFASNKKSSSGRGERQLAVKLQNIRGFDFDFLFDPTEEGGLFLRTIL